jgi:hypothetical protein
VRLSACNFNRVPSIDGSSVGTELHPVEFPARLHHGRSMSHVYVSRHIPGAVWSIPRNTSFSSTACSSSCGLLNLRIPAPLPPMFALTTTG